MTATTSRHDSEGGASPTLRPEHAGNIALFGACRVRYCAYDALPAAFTLRTMPIPGNPRGTPFRCGCPGHEAGRRRLIGAVAALPRHTRATAPKGRRWAARGTSRGGTEGRRSGTPRRRSAAWISGSAQPQRQRSESANSDRNQRQRQRQDGERKVRRRTTARSTAAANLRSGSRPRRT